MNQKEKTLLFEGYIEKGLVTRDGKGYTLIRGDSTTYFLGSNKVNSIVRLVEIINTEKGSATTTTAQSSEPNTTLDEATVESDKLDTTLDEAIKTSIKSKETLEEATPTDKLPVMHKKVNANELSDEELMKQLISESVKAVTTGATESMDILWKGVYFWDESKDVIKNCPFALYWANRGRGGGKIITDSEGDMSCEGWTVFTKHSELGKLIMKPGNLTIFRDDTPASPMVTLGEHVLCIESKEDYRARVQGRILKRLKIKKAAELARRLTGKNFHKTSSPESAMEQISGINESEKTTDAEFREKVEKLQQLGESARAL